MKLTNEELIQFLTKLLEQTKEGSLVWSPPAVQDVHSIFPDYTLEDCVFFCTIQNKAGNAEVGIARSIDGETLLAIRVSIMGAFVLIEPQSSEARVLALRLFHVIYDRSTKVNVFIRSFVSENSGSG